MALGANGPFWWPQKRQNGPSFLLGAIGRPFDCKKLHAKWPFWPQILHGERGSRLSARTTLAPSGHEELCGNLQGVSTYIIWGHWGHLYCK